MTTPPTRAQLQELLATLKRPSGVETVLDSLAGLPAGEAALIECDALAEARRLDDGGALAELDELAARRSRVAMRGTQ